MVNPVALAMVGLIMGVGGAVTYATFHYAEKADNTDVNGMLPMPPGEGPPLPKFLALKWPWKK